MSKNRILPLLPLLLLLMIFPAVAPFVPMAAAYGTGKNMPKTPETSGESVFSQQDVTLDYSNSSQGYIMAKYGGSGKIKVLIYYNGSSAYYQYNLAAGGVYSTLPLQNGSGAYRVRFMENVYGNSYAELCSTELSAAVSGQGCFVYPNQYVDYTTTSAAVAQAQSLCAKSANNEQKVAAIYQFIIKNIKYDYAKAGSVKSGYLPNVDSTLSVKKGICFDYSALMACMCRSQGIPAKLVMGTTNLGYHAWNEVYLDGWKRYDSTFAAAGQSAGVYTAEKYY
ncbi:MAG TPA: transglutaminase-like domain-containing protein [Caproiciproducens sp.]|nr:transglutaminase-like domain-containing protein [Caproiciproducens sp.]